VGDKRLAVAADGHVVVLGLGAIVIAELVVVDVDEAGIVERGVDRRGQICGDDVRAADVSAMLEVGGQANHCLVNVSNCELNAEIELGLIIRKYIKKNKF
jgi:hypothetical protein